MSKAIFIFHKDGKPRPMKQKLAEHLQKAGKGYIRGNEYLTRHMEAGPPFSLSGSESKPAAPVNATEAAADLAREMGVDISTIQGTGSGGVITVADVKKAAKGAE